MIEHAISLEKYGSIEGGIDRRVKYEYKFPRTREAWEEKCIEFFDSKSDIQASVVTRKVEDFCLPTLIGFGNTLLSPAETYCLAWKTLKDRGLSVVPSVRIVSRNEVATTNLSADEITSIYDQKIDALGGRDVFPMDTGFVKIPMDKIKKEGEILQKRANQMGVELMSDGPFHIVVREDGTWYLILLDIGKVRIYAKPKNMPNCVEKNNVYYVRQAIIAFAKIQQNIKALRDARGLS
jgi:hypothetical protein